MYDVLLHIRDFSEVVRCKLIVKKCLPILLCKLDSFILHKNVLYRMHIVNRKIFMCIFKWSLHANVSELLQRFNIKLLQGLIDINLKTSHEYSGITSETLNSMKHIKLLGPVTLRIYAYSHRMPCSWFYELITLSLFL